VCPQVGVDVQADVLQVGGPCRGAAWTARPTPPARPCGSPPAALRRPLSPARESALEDDPCPAVLTTHGELDHEAGAGPRPVLADPAVALLTSPWPGQRPPSRRCSSRDPACRRRSRPDDGLLQMQGPSLLKPRAVDGRTACGARAVTTEARSLGASVRVLQSSSSGRAETWTGDGSDPDPCRREPVHAFAPRRLAAGGCETGWGWPAGGPTTRRPATRPRPDVRARWTVPRAVGRVGGDRLQRVRCPTIAGTGPTGERPRPGPGQRARTGGAWGVALDRAVRAAARWAPHRR
jgi:hypothetical protein